jgi:uncharacterized protein (TIGR00299 family) protein
VLKLWEMRQVPIYSNGIAKEMVTPTGAAIVTTLAVGFGAPPPLVLKQVGLGAGSQNLAIPNILRLWLGDPDEGRSAAHDAAHAHAHHAHSVPTLHQATETQQTVTVLETQVDDLSPQAIGYTFEMLFAAGALDVFTQAVGMKKSRMGVLLTVICPVDRAADCEAVLFRETTTLGVRRSQQTRSILQREFQPIHTPYGTVQVKIARSAAGKVLNVQPEYEDCAKIARSVEQPWREIHRLALQGWHQQTTT